MSERSGTRRGKQWPGRPRPTPSPSGRDSPLGFFGQRQPTLLGVSHAGVDVGHGAAETSEFLVVASGGGERLGQPIVLGLEAGEFLLHGAKKPLEDAG